MAKDDYDKLVCMILVYLYARIRGQEKRLPEDYLVPMTKDFPIQDEYMYFILDNMLKKGLIEGINVTRAWGGEVVGVFNMPTIRITEEGIHYLKENSRMQNVLKWMRENGSAIGSLVTTALSVM